VKKANFPIIFVIAFLIFSWGSYFFSAKAGEEKGQVFLKAADTEEAVVSGTPAPTEDESSANNQKTPVETVELPTSTAIEKEELQQSTLTPLPPMMTASITPTPSMTYPGPGEVSPAVLPSLAEGKADRFGLSSPMLGNFACNQVHPKVQLLLDRMTYEQYSAWLEKLSGAQEVTIQGVPFTIRTRYSYAMFSPERSNARAFPYVLEQVRQWYPENQIEIDPYSYWGYTWKNLIVTIPGKTKPQEEVILSAHLDSISPIPYENAPGAEDNGSGSAALMEAARVMADQAYQRTIRIIWFSGEEQGLIGSQAYLADHPFQNIVGVINLDMYGYDSNLDRCFEMHVGTLPASDRVGQCMANVISTYGLDLNYDYLTYDSNLGCRSDHCPFLLKGIGAIEILENYAANSPSKGCGGLADPSPHYHKTSDTAANMNVSLAHDISRSAIAAAAMMAGPLIPIAIEPHSTLVDSSDVECTIHGEGFSAASIVYWQDEAINTTYISETELRARIPQSKLTAAGSFAVKVWLNDALGFSAPDYFLVENPIPELLELSPRTSVRRNEDLEISLTGNNFVSSSKVLWNGNEVETTFIQPNQLRARVPLHLWNSSEEAVVKVQSPAPGGGMSEPLTFTRVGVPQLISPQGTHTERRPVFQWKKVKGATVYFLQVYASSTFSPIAQEVICETSNCSFQPTFQLMHRSYQFRVKALSDTGWSEWSTWKVFTIVPPPPLGVPEILAPLGIVQASDLQVRWKRVERAESYQLWLDNEKLKTFSSEQAHCANGETECWVNWGEDLPNGRHKLQIRAFGVNQVSRFSLPTNFYVAIPLPAPQVLEPQIGDDNTVTFRWKAVSNAVRYYLLVYDGKNGRYTLRRYVAASACIGQICSYRYPYPLGSGSLYRVKVRAYFGSGKYSPYSDWQPFSIP